MVVLAFVFCIGASDALNNEIIQGLEARRAHLRGAIITYASRSIMQSTPGRCSRVISGPVWQCTITA